MALKLKGVQVIDVSDWDDIVQETYGKPYSFQQQDGCKSRGKEYITVPTCGYDYENDSIPEVINGEVMGVSFKSWLDREATAPLNPTDEELNSCGYFWKDSVRDEWCTSKSHINMFWERNFYPSVQTIANDLHAKGLLPAGEYMIDIDW